MKLRDFEYVAESENGLVQTGSHFNLQYLPHNLSNKTDVSGLTIDSFAYGVLGWLILFNEIPWQSASLTDQQYEYCYKPEHKNFPTKVLQGYRMQKYE
jgi:hypothetical protein